MPLRPLLLVLYIYLQLHAGASASDGFKSSTTADHLFHVRVPNTAQKQMQRGRGASEEVVPSHQKPAYLDEDSPQAPAAVAFDAIGAAPTLAKQLAVFTLVRGGSSEADYESFVSSRRCLNNVMPAWVSYEHVAFREGPPTCSECCAGECECCTL